MLLSFKLYSLFLTPLVASLSSLQFFFNYCAAHPDARPQHVA